MIVVHGLWRDGRLVLWGEDSSVPLASRREHPFAVSADALSRLTGTRTARATTTVVSLPTQSGVPLDSPELVRDELRQGRGAVTLRDWTVPAVGLDADAALRLLLAGLPDDATSGATMRHLREVAAFADDLVSRGRLLPSVVASTPPAAAWRPVLTAGDTRWAQALALALPPAGRAAGGTPAELVADAIDALVDASARAALGNVTALPGAGPAWRSFVGALVGTRRAFKAAPQDVSSLTDALTGWQRDALAGQVRACFRLIEPDPESSDADWRLEFSLQAADEPSLVVSADRVWKARGGLGALDRLLDDPQETLLGQLGRASRLYPALDEALRSARPAALDLDAGGAHSFLSNGAPLLAGAGFGVQLPGWWGKPKAKLGVRITAGTPTAPGTVAKSSAVGLDSIVDYQWELSLGDDPLTPAEMAALTDLKAPLVRLRGKWVELDHKRLAAGLKLLTAGGSMTVADLLHAGLSTQDGPGGLPVLSVSADGPLGDLLSGQVERRLAPVPTPPDFQGTLRPYQERGLAWLAFLQALGLGGILADDMGLGKTIQLLALLLTDTGRGPTLLVAPMSLVGNWAREAERFAPSLRVHVHHGAERARGSRFAALVEGADLVVTTYALAARDAAALADIDWHRIVVDEAQAIKNAATRQAVAVRSLPARHRVAVTGTPVENRLADLWSIMEFANPGLLGTATAFKARYAEPVERRGDEAAAERLRRLTGLFVLRRVKTDKAIISDLP